MPCACCCSANQRVHCAAAGLGAPYAKDERIIRGHRSLVSQCGHLGYDYLRKQAPDAKLWLQLRGDSVGPALPRCSAPHARLQVDGPDECQRSNALERKAVLHRRVVCLYHLAQRFVVAKQRMFLTSCSQQLSVLSQ